MPESKEQQLFFMRWAIELGQKGRNTAPPNPWVGCVIVKEGEILAEGFHEVAGGKHAEMIALEKASLMGRSLTQGATAYVSLEPCAHHGKTPPCAEALIAAGIKKVIIPLLDPDSKVSGKGVEILKKGGVEVIIGIGKEEAEQSLKAYLYHRKTGRPYCVLKSAISLDGKIAACDGSSKWISNEEARSDAHRLRAECQAIIVGSQTILVDHPRLTVRGMKIEKQPLRVILDRRGRLSPMGSLADPNEAPTLLFTSSSSYVTAWEKSGAEVILTPDITPLYVLEELGRRGVIQALVEGGSHLHSSFVESHVANRWVFYLNPILLGQNALPFLPHLTVSTLSAAPRFHLEGVHRFGDALRLDYLL